MKNVIMIVIMAFAIHAGAQERGQRIKLERERPIGNVGRGGVVRPKVTPRVPRTRPKVTRTTPRTTQTRPKVQNTPRSTNTRQQPVRRTRQGIIVNNRYHHRGGFNNNRFRYNRFNGFNGYRSGFGRYTPIYNQSYFPPLFTVEDRQIAYKNALENARAKWLFKYSLKPTKRRARKLMKFNILTGRDRYDGIR